MSSANFADRLAARSDAKRSAVCVGLDPRIGMLPEEYRVPADASPAGGAAAIAAWARAVVDVVAPLAPVVKPQLAFFEMHGAEGFRAYQETVAYARRAGLLVIADAKRGDIGSTAQAYAAAHLSDEGADAVTLNPYLGRDSLAPFLERCVEAGKGVFVLVRTSNPGARDLQDCTVDGGPMYERVAAMVRELGLGEGLVGDTGWSSVGAVTGATYPEELTRLREAMPHTPFLVPGYGAQGAGEQDCAGAFAEDGLGAVVNSSRGITFAFRQGDNAGRFGDDRWRESVEAAVCEMRDALNRVRSPGGGGGR